MRHREAEPAEATPFDFQSAGVPLRAEPEPKRPRWNAIFFSLATAYFLSVLTGLYLNREITGLYADSIQYNERWAGQMARYFELAQAAHAVSEPSSDIFNTKDLIREYERMRLAR